MHSFRADSAGIFQRRFDHRSLEDHDSDIEFMRPILDHGSIQSSVDALGAGINALKAQAHDEARVSALNQVAARRSEAAFTRRSSKQSCTKLAGEPFAQARRGARQSSQVAARRSSQTSCAQEPRKEARGEACKAAARRARGRARREAGMCSRRPAVLAPNDRSLVPAAERVVATCFSAHFYRIRCRNPMDAS
jgi:hypothetical protein